jgi:hypothetical protein
MIRFLMQLNASKYICFLYIITFLDSLLEGLQGCPTLKQIVSLNIGLKHIISYYNQGHIIQELRTRVLARVTIAQDSYAQCGGLHRILKRLTRTTKYVYTTTYVRCTTQAPSGGFPSYSTWVKTPINIPYFWT